MFLKSEHNAKYMEESECSHAENEPLLKSLNSPVARTLKKLSKEDPRIVVTAKVSLIEKLRRRKALKKFYFDQDKLIELYRQDDKASRGLDQVQLAKDSEIESDRKRGVDRVFASLIFGLNVTMLFGNLTAAILSGSYSVVRCIKISALFIDSTMDLTSSTIVLITIWAINNTNMSKYPRGRQRLEVLAVIMCSVLMGVANIIMIVSSVQAIITKSVDPDANLITISILLGGILIKSIFMIICYRHGTTNSLIFAMDQRNDIITNTVALFGAYIGDHYWLYADPVGAILVCTFIAVSWFTNAFENIPLIVGVTDEKEHISRILRLAIEHDERIKYLDHLMVYHIGKKALVEMHIVLDEHLPLKVTHDLTEALEQKIKALDFVERVFMHVDYRCDLDWQY